MMKLSKYFLVLPLIYGFTLNAQELQDYKWKNRLLLLFDQSNETPALISQWHQFTNLKTECSERDLKLLIITNNSVFLDNTTKADAALDTQSIRARFGISEHFKGIVLVGKDGGKKLQEKFEVNPLMVFELIDGMPMRRAEMRNN
ncbi:DUF4174 domain-containing protein [uncultured Kriegella sp.]|uniref:DUF4174 domain-containing protein n=1 Tax=uncultured Kriegella sp. TaxID=1798910 RepID=UPI0030D96A8B|tara:strand:+ start:67058 stop:67492 length:435 start_codon:yes stop_codon:yes gene_type:complete